MKKYYRLLTIGLLLGAISLPTSAQVSNDNEDEVVKINDRQSRYEYVPGQVLLKFKDSKRVQIRRAGARYQAPNANKVDALLQKYGVAEMEQLLPKENPRRQMRRSKAFNGTTVEEHDLSQLYCITLSEEHVLEAMQMMEELKVLDEVEYAEPNYILHTLEDTNIAASFGGNPYATSQWYLSNYGVTQLWNIPIVNPTRPVIAIIDTGVDMTHPDLVPNLWTNTAEANGEPNYDNDGNGFAGDVHGWDFINNTPNVRDFNMHGTHVAGIAAAANNGIGIIGANPRALIMPVSVMQSDGTGDVATIVKGINYAVQNGATVLNLSLGTYANSNALRQALGNAYQSAVIVAAAGNDRRCVNSPHHPSPCFEASPMFPAAYSFVLGVQATTNTGALAIFSNYDDDGNLFSMVTTLQDPDGFNYELKAPGTNMLSTVPGGKYKTLQGTSMAAPLVAGSISALKMVKNYDSQEILWGDLLHTDNIAQAYAISARPAELNVMKIMYRERKELPDETEEDYSGDGRIDAGETVCIYPVIRTTFGEASNIKMHLEMGDELEDASTVEILTNEVDFGMHLDAYGKGVSLNPLKLKVAENVANGRHIKMKVVITCDESSNVFESFFTIVVDNVTKISGFITEDITLTSDHIYMVPSSLGVPEGKTLTIEPGTKILFAPNVGLSCSGTLVAVGTPEKPIIFSCSDGNNFWGTIHAKETIKYCIIDKSYTYRGTGDIPPMEDCVITEQKYLFSPLGTFNMIRCNYLNSVGALPPYYGGEKCIKHSNIINNIWDSYNSNLGSQIDNSIFDNVNLINSYWTYSNGKHYTLGADRSMPEEVTVNSIYLGSSRESIFRNYFWEIGNSEGDNETFAYLNTDNILLSPDIEAHGIVWKVVVNGYDAQDEYEQLPPLGVGKHKFEVYFNRPMNKEVAPQISFGVRDPWTQHAVAEEGDGSGWNAEGTIYTAYFTITGKTKSDGINRIYVYGAEDNEFFEIPYEKTRFNINIQAAGSLATGFTGEAGLGKVTLTWNNENNDFTDAMGFNVYRYTLDSNNEPANLTRLNQEILDIEATEYIDYEVTPGETYYYYYNVLSTDLQEYDQSNTVAVTPETATLGDANGSGDVDVQDVITTVNYAAGMEPRPFIFEAADMNTDQLIDILDVIGIIQKILNPAAPALAMIENVATYTIEDGVVYVDSPVALAGVQFQLVAEEGQTFTVAPDLDGFEHTSAWLSDEDYLFMAYNMSGKTLPAGKHALLRIGDAKIASIRLGNAAGGNVTAVEGGTTTIGQTITNASTIMGIYNLHGQRVAVSADQLQLLPKGVYIVDGKKVIKWK